MRSNIWLKILGLNLALMLTIPADAGNIGGASTGGGNAKTDQYRDLMDTFGRDSILMKARLKIFLEMVNNFSAQGKISALLQSLIAQGLVDDIERTKYEFSKKCEDQGREVDASTSVGVRNADICIGYPGIIRKNASLESIAGLLLEEHVRHFIADGITSADAEAVAGFVRDRFEYFHIDRALEWSLMHINSGKEYYEGAALRRLKNKNANDPIAVQQAIQERYKWSYGPAASQALVKGVMYRPEYYSDYYRENSYFGGEIYISDRTSVYLEIEELSGQCQNELELYHAKDDWWRKDPYYKVRIAKGAKIPLMYSSLIKYSHDYPFLGDLFGLLKCYVKFAVVTPYGKASLPVRPFQILNGYAAIEVHELNFNDQSIEPWKKLHGKFSATDFAKHIIFQPQ
jgi:hypothetical protein